MLLSRFMQILFTVKSWPDIACDSNIELCCVVELCRRQRLVKVQNYAVGNTIILGSYTMRSVLDSRVSANVLCHLHLRLSAPLRHLNPASESPSLHTQCPCKMVCKTFCKTFCKMFCKTFCKTFCMGLWYHETNPQRFREHSKNK